MKLIILCGGIGDSAVDYSMPTPMNMIYGKPSIYFVLSNLPDEIKELYFIYGAHLKRYNFEETVINLFKTKTCRFYCVEYLTRGPVETAYVGTSKLGINLDEPVVFLDNDHIYKFPDVFFQDKEYSFVGISQDNSGSTEYSFVEEKDNILYAIVEKERISNVFCCGVYGFQTLQTFRETAHSLLTSNSSFPNKDKIYMSDVYRLLLQEGNRIKTIFFANEANNIGTLQDLKRSLTVIQKPLMRICFDLDNTLVSYPTIPGDYSSVKPIEETIHLVRKLKEEGHTIIIHTARRMQSHKHNVGAAIRDIGKVTFDTLEKFNIPYDELFFGKPNADIYVDDKSVNPLKGDYTYLGLFTSLNQERIINKLPNNKFNKVELEKNKVVKIGLKEHLQGEFYVYSQLYKFPTIRSYFPEFYSYTEVGDQCRLEMEYIKGVPLYYLFRNGLMHKEIITKLIHMVEQFHNASGPIDISKSAIIENYRDKLVSRFKNDADYPFPDAKEVQEVVLGKLSEYINSDAIQVVPFIHGDFWFSNVTYTFDKKLKCFDMRGRINTVMTTNGDPLYDFGKLYQSFLGYDIALWDNYTSYTSEMRELCKMYELELSKRGISLEYLKSVTNCLIIGTLPFIESNEKKKEIWNFLKMHL